MINKDLDKTFTDIIEEIKLIWRSSAPLILTIDGRAASGKSTIAEMFALKLDGSIVHADDFFLPYDLRTPERLAEPGGNVHYERFEEEVVRNLKSKKSFSYGVFDCGKGNVTSQRIIDCSTPVIVEGAYSASPRFGKYFDILIFCTASYEVRFSRVVRRNGAEKAKIFKERWMPLEEAYFNSFGIENNADYIIDTTCAW